MRAQVGRAFRRACVTEMARVLPAFKPHKSTLQGSVLLTAPGTTAPWGHILFIPDRWCDMFTMELAHSELPVYPVGKYCHDLDAWRSARDSCIRINRLEGTRYDLWWSPIDRSYVEQLKLVADDALPPVEEAVRRMPAAVASAVEYLARRAVPLL